MNSSKNDIEFKPDFLKTYLSLQIPRYAVESDHYCTSRIYFYNTDDNADVIKRDGDITEIMLT